MKKFLLLAAAIGSLAFVGCDEKNDPQLPPESEIVLDGYEEPYMKWGATKAEIKRSVPYELLSDTDSGLSFAGKEKVSGYIYLTTFKGVTNSLASSIALVSTAYSSELSEFLFSKYVPVTADEENYRFYCINKDKTLAVVLEIYSSKLLTVTYLPVDLSGSAAASRMFGLKAVGLKAVDADADAESMRMIYDSLRMIANI